MSKLNSKAVYAISLITLILILLFASPIARFPWDGVKVQGFYQVMDNNGYQAIDWVKQNTPKNSVFVSDMGYGWWLTGFGQRPTITNIPLQAISLANEVSISINASYLLDTDYVLDNGYIQVREDGGYINRHNPLFLADLNSTDIPYGFFQFNSSEVTLLSHKGNTAASTNLAELPVTSMQLINENTDSPSIIVDRANNAVDYSEIVTVTKGSLFANMTIIVQNNQPDVSLDWLNFVVNSPGIFQQSFNNTLAILDPDTKECGQLIFAQSNPTVANFSPQNPCITQLTYNLQNSSKTEIQILIGMFAVSNNDVQNSTATSDLEKTLSANLQNPATASDMPITTFDYKAAIQQYNVSYIVNRDFELNPKYANDPAFSPAFINDEVSIFQVKANATTIKG